MKNVRHEWGGDIYNKLRAILDKEAALFFRVEEGKWGGNQGIQKQR